MRLTNRLTAARSRLAARYLPLAWRIAYDLCRRYRMVPREDLLSAATWGLMEAAGRFDPARQVRFGSYARRLILGRCLDAIRAGAKERARHPVRLDEIGPDEQIRFQIDYGPNPARQVEQADAAAAILRRLPATTARILDLISHGLSQAEAARQVGLSPPRVSALLIEARSMIQGGW